MSKHTPGPWTVHQDSDGWLQVMSGGASGRIVANVNAESCPSVASFYLPVVMPADANARLIADAPELLDVCRELLGPMIVWSQHWASHYNGGKLSPAHEEIIQRASAAIARNTPNEDADNAATPTD